MWTYFIALLTYDYVNTFQVSQVFAVCIVGYTAAVVSVIAGTILAQECSQQLTTAVSRLTSDILAGNNTSAQSPETTLFLPSSHVTDSLHELTGEWH